MACLQAAANKPIPSATFLTSPGFSAFKGHGADLMKTDGEDRFPLGPVSAPASQWSQRRKRQKPGWREIVQNTLSRVLAASRHVQGVRRCSHVTPFTRGQLMATGTAECAGVPWPPCWRWSYPALPWKHCFPSSFAGNCQPFGVSLRNFSFGRNLLRANKSA